MGEGFTQLKEADMLERNGEICKQLYKLYEVRYGWLLARLRLSEAKSYPT